jgi:hypothetical protein
VAVQDLFGENIDEVVAKLSNHLRDSNERLRQLKAAGGFRYADELQQNVHIGQELLGRVCHLADIQL